MKTKKNARKKFLGLFCVSAVLFTLGLHFMPHVMHTMFVYPLIALQDLVTTTIQSWNYYFLSKQKLSEERDVYQQRAQCLQGQLLALKARRLFLETTKDIRDYQEMYGNNKTILARVILYHADQAEQYFLINRGASDGIALDQSVVYKQILVGRITEVYPLYSKVMLLTDPQCKVAVICEKTKTMGIYQGSGSEQHGFLKHVSHMQPLVIGDTLLSAGEGLIFPYGFGVGTIVSFEQKGIQYEVLIKPCIEYKNIRYCSILRSER